MLSNYARSTPLRGLKSFKYNTCKTKPHNSFRSNTYTKTGEGTYAHHWSQVAGHGSPGQLPFSFPRGAFRDMKNFGRPLISNHD